MGYVELVDQRLFRTILQQWVKIQIKISNSKDYSSIFFFLIVELENICACIYMAMLEIGTPYAQGTMLSGCVTFIVDERNWQKK